MGQQQGPAVAVLGMGLMGVPLAHRLLEKGWRVTVWNRTAEKCRPLAEAGAQVAASPAAAAEASEIALLCLLDTATVESVVFGLEGLAQGGGAGKLVVDLSTVSAARTREMAARLSAACGMGWIDAPVSGGPPAAAAGELAIMAGGAAEDLAHALPVLEELGRVTHMGPVGAGQATKMINQVIVGANFCVLAEALRLAEDNGIEARLIPQALAGGYADSVLLQKLWERFLARDFEPPRGLAKQMLKDLDMVAELARASGTPTPMASQAASLYRLLVARGLGGIDSAGLLRLYERESP